MKYILLIGDGMADNALPELGGKTPLEYAKTPVMDVMASAGTVGSVLTVPEGLPPGSDTAILTIFGCDSAVHYGGRAPLEAAAMGVQMQPGDVAYRCNMVTFEDGDIPFENKKILSHSAGSIDGDASDALVRDLFDNAEFKRAAGAAGISVFPGGSFRHIAVQKLGVRKSEQSSLWELGVRNLRIIPPHDHLGEVIGGLLPQGGDLADTLTELMRLAHGILDNHPINTQRRRSGKLPANGVWFWAEGVATKLPDFRDKYGKKGAVISAVPLCKGIGALMGLDIINVPGATGELNTNYEGKVEAAVKALETHDFVSVHIEAPDECTHDGDLNGKLQAIEWIDSRVAAPLTQKLRNGSTDFRMLVISDHKTLISTRGHAGDPVPFMIYDSSGDKKTGLRFNEDCTGHGDYISDGTKLMGMLFDDTNR